MRYVEARIDEYNREQTYRFYVTKSLQLIPQSKYLETQYLDMLKPQEKSKTGDDIVRETMKLAGLKFGE